MKVITENNKVYTSAAVPESMKSPVVCVPDESYYRK
jgi:hypothetical protein